MAEERRKVIEDPNDPRYGEYDYGDNNADENGLPPTHRDYQPPNLEYTTENPHDPTLDADGNRLPDYRQAMGTALGEKPIADAMRQAVASQSQPPSGGSQYQSAQAAVTPPSMTGFNGAPFNPITRPNITNAYTQPLQAAILKLLGTNTEPTAEELARTPQNYAVRLGAQRAFERDREALAEQSAGEGWSDSGAFDTGMAGLRQRRGETETAFLGQFADAEINRRIDQLKYGIQVAEAHGQFEASQEMQAQLANLDAIMRRNEMAERARQFDLGLGYDYTALGVNANQAATQALLG